MNTRMILNTLGRIVKLEAALLLLPCAAAVFYSETRTALSFAGTAAAAFALGFLLTHLTRKGDRTIYAREGFVITAFGWILLSLIGAAPFVFAGDIPSYVDALFETVSGFTTTGASILTDVEALSKGGLFWRSFTHWIGGMGILVMMMAILPNSEGRSIHIMRAEMPGPVVDKIVPKVRETAKILYLIYIGITVTQVIFLLFGGLSLYESLLYTFGTVGTGGFGLRGDSLAGYSAYVQWVITVFMFLCGVNFNLYYLILNGKVRAALRSEELRVFVGLILFSSLVIGLNIAPLCGSVSETIRTAVFQVLSIVSTTGYATADFNLWPGLSKGLLFLLLFLGGCAGSTAGGLKLSRAMMLCKMIRRELHRMLHPRSVYTVRFEGKPLSAEVQTGVSTYFALYCLGMAATFFLICLFDPFDLETNLSAAISCFNNVGPGFSGVGPMAGYAAYSPISKMILAVAMLLGRLELYPLLLTFSPSTWVRR